MQTIDDYNLERERRAELEHRDVLLAIAALLKTKEGRSFFQYLFKSLDVGVVPEQGLSGEQLHDYLGFLRAGNSIYKLTCEADFEEAARIMSKIEREKYDDLIEQHRLITGQEPGDSE